jgi:hypothetical protein
VSDALSPEDSHAASVTCTWSLPPPVKHKMAQDPVLAESEVRKEEFLMCTIKLTKSL